jgi:DNA segregation ATPase FtsK/SpoIIIE-like protein
VKSATEKIYLACGESDDLLWNQDENPNILISGGTGSGKTELIKNIMSQCNTADWNIFALDLVCGSLGKWMQRTFDSESTTTLEIATTIKEAESAVSSIISEIFWRRAYMEEEDVKDFKNLSVKLSPTLLVIDDAFSVLKLASEQAVSQEAQAQLTALRIMLFDILVIGPAAGVFTVMATQRVEWDLYPEFIERFDWRLAVGKHSVESSIELLGNENAVNLPEAKDTGYFQKNGEGQRVKLCRSIDSM